MDNLNLTTPDPAATRRQLEQICDLRLSERLVQPCVSANNTNDVMLAVAAVAPDETRGSRAMAKDAALN